MRQLQVLTGQAKEIKTYAASLNGWQSGFVADVYRLGAARSLGGDSVNFKAWQQERERFDRFLALVPTDGLTTTERQQLDRVRAEFTQYVETNDRLVETYRPGTPQALFSGDQIALYDSWNTFYRVMVVAQQLADSLDARSRAAIADAEQAADTAEWVIGVGTALACTLGAILAIAVTRSIVRPIAEARDALNQVAQRNLTVELTGSGQDEAAQMSAALRQAVVAVREVVQNVAAQADGMASTSAELDHVSGAFAATASATSQQAELVASAAEDVSRNVSSVAAGSEEMGASIGEISRNATDAVQVAGEAVQAASSASHTITTLGSSSAAIGDAVRLITSIAHQTNLLSLNATIEAARAGDMGKGFGVVASEVKELAQESARAAEEIDRLVQAIQGDTVATVDAITRIETVIGRISEFQTTIAGAVEEQTATTEEMNRGASAASNSTSQIAEGIREVAVATSSASTEVARSRDAAARLSRMAGELRDAVGQFRY